MCIRDRFFAAASSRAVYLRDLALLVDGMAIPMSDATLATGLDGRHLPLQGTYNVRDLGGYLATGDRVTRWRTLLRADALHRLDGDAHAVFGALGVRTVVDLRSDEELSLIHI